LANNSVIPARELDILELFFENANSFLDPVAVEEEAAAGLEPAILSVLGNKNDTAESNGREKHKDGLDIVLDNTGIWVYPFAASS